MFSTAAEAGLFVFRKIADKWNKDSANMAAGMQSDSLIEYTQSARVEPIVLIDSDCLYLESLSEIQQSLLSIFAGYYLQAIAISYTIGNIDVMRTLDKLNPRRDPSNSASGMGWLLTQESYKHGLPVIDKCVALEAMALEVEGDKADNEYKEYLAAKQVEINNQKYNLDYDKFTSDQLNKAHDRLAKEKELAAKAEEAKKNYELNKEKFDAEKAQTIFQNELAKAGFELKKAERNDKLTATEIGFGKDTMSTLKELANLSVGKLFSVEITDGIHKASIPVNIRLMASSLPSTSLVHILSVGNEDISIRERYHAWRSGRIEFIKDLVFCQDLIDTHRKNLMADKDGIYSNLVKRARDNQISGIVSANPSIATASNLAIMSTTTAEQLEIKVMGKLSEFKTREKIFKSTSLMIMCVVDKQWERCTFYHRGIHLPSEVSMRDLKAGNKNGGPDVSEILKAFQLGNPASL